MNYGIATVHMGKLAVISSRVKNSSVKEFVTRFTVSWEGVNLRTTGAADFRRQWIQSFLR